MKARFYKAAYFMIGAFVGAGILAAVWNGSCLSYWRMKRGGVVEVATGDGKILKLTSYQGQLYRLVWVPNEKEEELKWPPVKK